MLRLHPLKARGPRPTGAHPAEDPQDKEQLTMTTLIESSTPPTTETLFPDTSVYVSLLVTAGTDATVSDNSQHADLVSVQFGGCGEATRAHLQGSLADVQRLVDDIAHQL